jgi:hypothetical protein
MRLLARAPTEAAKWRIAERVHVVRDIDATTGPPRPNDCMI